jgi:hypothetical protein
MELDKLVEIWQTEAVGDLTDEEYKVRLTIEDAARLEALAELFPRRTREQLISELMSVVLHEIVGRFHYVKGSKVITHDEDGIPEFEDVGYTPRYLKLVKKHTERLAQAKNQAS